MKFHPTIPHLEDYWSLRESIWQLHPYWHANDSTKKWTEPLKIKRFSNCDEMGGLATSNIFISIVQGLPCFLFFLSEKVMPLLPWIIRRYPGGLLNVCYNALDRHVEDGHGDQVALIHDSPITKSAPKSLTYRELLEMVRTSKIFLF